MMMAKKKTLIERWPEKLKRSWPVIVIGMILTGITALAGGLTGFGKFKETFWPAPPSLSYHYRTLEGHSLSLFLQGALPSDLKEQIGSQYVIVQNDVWKFGNGLLRRHGYQADSESDIAFKFPTNASSKETEESLSTELKRYTLLEGTTWDDRTYESQRGSPFDEDNFIDTMDVGLDLLAKEDEDALRNKGIVEASRFSFEKTLSCEEFDQLAEENEWPHQEFYQEIMAKGCPKAFATARIWFTDGCANGWYVTAHPPRMKLRVVAIQNNDSKVVALSSLIVRTDPQDQARSEPSLGIAQESLELNNIPLRPGETAYVALQFLMTHDSTEEGDEAPPDEVSVLSPEEIAKIPNVTIERNDLGYEVEEIDVSSDESQEPNGGDNDETEITDQSLDALDSYLLTPLDSEASNPKSISMEGTKLGHWLSSSMANSLSLDDGLADFTIGPSQKLEMVTGPRYEVAARPAPEKSSVISEYIQGGSCPRLFASYPDVAKPIYKGKFLVDANLDGVDKIDHIELVDWPSRLTVEEWEYETTRLSAVDIICYRNGGERTETSVAKYSAPHELSMGDKLTLPVPPKPTGMSCDMVLARFNGHYITHSDSTASKTEGTRPSASSVMQPTARYQGGYCAATNKPKRKLLSLR